MILLIKHLMYIRNTIILLKKNQVFIKYPLQLIFYVLMLLIKLAKQLNLIHQIKKIQLYLIPQHLYINNKIMYEIYFLQLHYEIIFKICFIHLKMTLYLHLIHININLVYYINNIYILVKLFIHHLLKVIKKMMNINLIL